MNRGRCVVSASPPRVTSSAVSVPSFCPEHPQNESGFLRLSAHSPAPTPARKTVRTVNDCWSLRMQVGRARRSRTLDRTPTLNRPAQHDRRDQQHVDEPPIVVALTNPSTHNSNNTTAIVHNIPPSSPRVTRRRRPVPQLRHVRSSSGPACRSPTAPGARPAPVPPRASAARNRAAVRANVERDARRPPGDLRAQLREQRVPVAQHARASARRSSGASGLRSSFRALDSSASCAWTQR